MLAVAAAMESVNSSVPLNYYHQNNDSDRTGALWTVAGLGFSYVACTSLVRLFLRKTALKVDDYVFLAALVGPWRRAPKTLV